MYHIIWPMQYRFSIHKAIVKKVFSDFIKVERCFQLRIFERNVFHILQQMPLDDALKTIISHRNIGLDPKSVQPHCNGENIIFNFTIQNKEINPCLLFHSLSFFKRKMPK